MKCRVCGTEDSAMVFRNDPWCCDDHRKVVQGEKAPSKKEIESMDADLLTELTNGSMEPIEPGYVLQTPHYVNNSDGVIEIEIKDNRGNVALESRLLPGQSLNLSPLEGGMAYTFRVREYDSELPDVYAMQDGVIERIEKP